MRMDTPSPLRIGDGIAKAPRMISFICCVVLMVGIWGLHSVTAVSSSLWELTFVEQSCDMICSSHCEVKHKACDVCLSECARDTQRFALDGGDGGANRATAVCTSDGKVLPTLFVLGAQKAGTTSMYQDLLDAFPGAAAGPVIPPGSTDPDYFHKELHFFDDPKRFVRGVDLYTSYFTRFTCAQAQRKGKIPFECTPNYFALEVWQEGIAWERAKAFYSKAVPDPSSLQHLTFVIVVRDPAARYISAFNHFCVRENHSDWPMCDSLLGGARRATAEPGCAVNVGESIAGCSSDMLRVGMYWVALSGWVNAFPDARFIVTTFSQYVEDPNPVLGEIGRALGIKAKQKKKNAQILNHGDHSALPADDVVEAINVLNRFYKGHTQYFWSMLAGMLIGDRNTPGNKKRVTFVGTLGHY